MKIECIAGFATITSDPAASAALYLDTLGLPLERREDYLSIDKFPGAHHFGVWPLIGTDSLPHPSGIQNRYPL